MKSPLDIIELDAPKLLEFFHLLFPKMIPIVGGSFHKIQYFVLILLVLEENNKLESPVSLLEIGVFDQDILKKRKNDA